MFLLCVQAIYACADCCRSGRNAEGTPCFNSEFPESQCCARPVPLSNRISEAEIAALMGSAYNQQSGSARDSRGYALAVDSRGSLALTYGSVLDSRGRESPRKAFVEAANVAASAGMSMQRDQSATNSAEQTTSPFQTIAITCAGVVGAIAIVGAIAFVAIQQRKRSVVRPQAYIEPERPAVMPITVLTTQPGAKADKVVPWEHRSP